MTAADEMLKAEKEGKAVFGTDKTIRALKNGKVEKVFIASNTSEDVREEINNLAKLAEVEVVEISETNEQFATLSKKLFNISVASILQ